MALPPKCPELSPAENVWQFMRGNWLSNRIFKSCEDILDHCCFAWNKLIDQQWRIMSIDLREWARAFCSMRIGLSGRLPLLQPLPTGVGDLIRWISVTEIFGLDRS